MPTPRHHRELATLREMTPARLVFFLTVLVSSEALTLPPASIGRAKQAEIKQPKKTRIARRPRPVMLLGDGMPNLDELIGSGGHQSLEELLDTPLFVPRNEIESLAFAGLWLSVCMSVAMSLVRLYVVAAS